MKEIFVIDRSSREFVREKIYGESALYFLYDTQGLKKYISLFCLNLIARLPFFSHFYGWLQKRSFSKRKIEKFIKKFNINTADFLLSSDSFKSFNDFFIRKLKPESRPIDSAESHAILPADGRYLAYQRIAPFQTFRIKGQNFSLKELLQDETLAKRYEGGTLVIARLCPVDYHRFHFPVDCVPGKARLIDGPLFSVSPVALKKHLEYLTQNKRVVTELESERFGKVQFIEVGATNVGSICQTAEPHIFHRKGEEKGYFEFGGSCLILLFEPGRIKLDEDLIAATESGYEMLGLMGQSLGQEIA